MVRFILLLSISDFHLNFSGWGDNLILVSNKSTRWSALLDYTLDT